MELGGWTLSYRSQIPQSGAGVMEDVEPRGAPDPNATMQQQFARGIEASEARMRALMTEYLGAIRADIAELKAAQGMHESSSPRHGSSGFSFGGGSSRHPHEQEDSFHQRTAADAAAEGSLIMPPAQSPPPPPPSKDAARDAATGSTGPSQQMRKSVRKARLGAREQRHSVSVSYSTPQEKMWALVENDGEIRTILRDVRTRIVDYAEKHDGRGHHQHGPALLSNPDAEGTFHVLLLKGISLMPQDANGLSDPYAKVCLGAQTRKSQTIKKTLNPVWHEAFEFRGVLGKLMQQPLKIQLYDFDLTSLDDPMGKAEFNLDNGHVYYDGVRRDVNLSIDTQGGVALQVWWEPYPSHLQGAAARSGERLSTWTPNDAPTERHHTRLYRCCCGLLRRVVPKKVLRKGVCAALCLPVLHPDSRFRSTWNVCLAFFILYCGFAVPLEIAFETDMVGSMCRDPLDPFGPNIPRGECSTFLLWFWLNLIVDLFFIMDIFFNFRTGFVQDGHLVDDDWLVAKAYLKGSFLVDVLGTFPLNMLMMALNPANPYGDTVQYDDVAAAGGMDAGRANRLLRLMRMAKLLKLARMRKLAKYLSNFEEFLNPGVLAVFKLVFIAWFCCHLFGCLWWMISDIEIAEEESGASDPFLASPWYSGENTWHPPHWLKHEAALGMKYMHAFFWGAGMVTSLVPRDIEPLTALESITTCSTMFFGLLLNAFVISSLNQALATMNSKRLLASSQLESIKSYLLVRAVPADLRARILEYYEYLFTSSAALESMDMLELMPPALSAQLALSTNRKIAAHCPFFRDISNASLVKLVSELKAVVFVPEQVIVREGFELSAVYFINRGIVQMVSVDTATVTLSNSDNFGLDDFSDACVEELHEMLDADATFQAALIKQRKGEKHQAKRDEHGRPRSRRFTDKFHHHHHEGGRSNWLFRRGHASSSDKEHKEGRGMHSRSAHESTGLPHSSPESPRADDKEGAPGTSFKPQTLEERLNAKKTHFMDGLDA